MYLAQGRWEVVAGLVISMGKPWDCPKSHISVRQIPSSLPSQAQGRGLLASRLATRTDRDTSPGLACKQGMQARFPQQGAGRKPASMAE